MRGASRHKKKQLCLYSFLPISLLDSLLNLESRDTNQRGDTVEISLDAAKAYISGRVGRNKMKG